MRAIVFTATSLSLGISGHVVAGGSPPSTHLVVVLGLFVFGCARALAAGEKRLPVLVAGTLAVQVVVHVALMTGQMPMPGPAMKLTSAMLAAHAVAALVVAVLLRHAEAGVFAVRRWLAGVIRGAGTPSLAVPPTVPPAVVVAPRSPAGLGLLLAAACPRRGPPALA